MLVYIYVSYDLKLRDAAAASQAAENEVVEFINHERGMERAEYEKKIDELEKISDEKRKVYDACLEDVNNRTRDIYNIENFIKSLKATGTNGVQYDSALLKNTVEKIVVHKKEEKVVFHFYCGREVEIPL